MDDPGMNLRPHRRAWTGLQYVRWPLRERCLRWRRRQAQMKAYASAVA